MQQIQFRRMFSTDQVKGTQGYLDSQKGYEISRTLLYFALSLSLFLIGLFTTGTKTNLLTIVAVLGCLPASKSLVETIMFLRFKSCASGTALEINPHAEGMVSLYDCMFTSYSVTYRISHLAIAGDCICMLSQDNKIDEQALYKHLKDYLKLDGYKDITCKVYKTLPGYLERLDQMKQLQDDTDRSLGIANTLKSISL